MTPSVDRNLNLFEICIVCAVLWYSFDMPEPYQVNTQDVSLNSLHLPLSLKYPCMVFCGLVRSQKVFYDLIKSQNFIYHRFSWNQISLESASSGFQSKGAYLGFFAISSAGELFQELLLDVVVDWLVEFVWHPLIIEATMQRKNTCNLQMPI